MSKPAPTRYRTLNWSAYNASLRERGSLTVWFDPSTPWHAAPSGKRGGQPVYSDAAIQLCLTIKVLFGLPLRQTDRLRREPSEVRGARLAGAGLLDALPTAEDLGRSAALPGQRRPAAPARGQHGHQGPRQGGMARAQAWRGAQADLAKGPPRRRRGDTRGPRGRDHRQRRRRWACATGPARPGSSERADRLGHRRRRLRHPRLPRRHREPRRGRCHPARRNAKPSGEGQPRRRSEERGSARHQAPRPHDLAPMERIPPPKPRRDQDELHEAPRAKAHGPRLRPPDRPNSKSASPSSTAIPRSASPSHDPSADRRGERGSSAFRRSVQQSLPQGSVGWACCRRSVEAVA